MSDEAPKRGRPTDYTPELGAKICEELAKDRSLVKICEDEGMPSTTTVYRWRREHRDFRDNYARAREDQGHTVADQMSDIRAMLLAGEIDAATATAMAGMIKWESGKRAAKDFGDVQTMRHTGADGGPIKYANMSREERQARIKELQERQGREPDGTGGA